MIMKNERDDYNYTYDEIFNALKEMINDYQKRVEVNEVSKKTSKKNKDDAIL
jgi:hypothetical protein